MPPQPRSILVIDASPFGRSLSLLPAIRTIRSAYSGTYVVVATSAGTCELLVAAALADEVVDLGVTQSSSASFFGALKRIRRLVRGTRHKSFDLVLDMSPKLETQMAARLIVGGRTITPVKFPGVLDALLAASGRPRRALDHASDCESVLRQLGLRVADRRMAVEVPADQHARFEELLVRNGSRGGEPIAALYSGAVGKSSGWPVERFGEIGTRLKNNFGARVLAIDEPYDDSFTGAVGALLPLGAIRLASVRALEAAAAIARSSLVVTDDRGLAQLASDLNAPVLEISDSPSPSPDWAARRTVHASSRARVTADEVYDAGAEMLLMSRTVGLMHR